MDNPKRELNSTHFATVLKNHFAKFIFDNKLDFKVPYGAFKVLSVEGEKVIGFVTRQYRLHKDWEYTYFELGDPNLLPMLEDVLRHYYDK